MSSIGKTFIMGVATLGLAVGVMATTLESAEAAGRHGVRAAPAMRGAAPRVGRMGVPMRAGVYHRHHRGYGRGAGIAAGLAGAAILGAALVPAYASEECYLVRDRVWDDYRGHWVRVNRRVCD